MKALSGNAQVLGQSGVVVAANSMDNCLRQSNSGHLTHPQYRADIDGLRAIAVLSVIAYHAFPFWFKGGFVGVDIFFVISGYLISTIIIGNLERNTFSFVEFYSRRIKRIFPALLLVLIASFAFGWLVLLSDEYKQLGKHIAGGAGFISNLLLWKESGYFDGAAETKPLLHLWSLGVEEQFYVIWPLLLWFAWRRRTRLLTIAIAVAAISFALNIYKVNHDVVGAYFSPQTRFWELMAGAVLAHMTIHKQQLFPKMQGRLDAWLGRFIYAGVPDSGGKALRDVQALFGAALTVIAILVITKDVHFPGWWALLPTLGAALIISAGSAAWLNRVVLSHRVLVWFGLISFPLYLWHWPLLSFARIIEGDLPGRATRIGMVLVSIVLAWLTYRLIEKPVRLSNQSQTKTIALLACMVLVGSVGFACYQQEGLKFRVSQFDKISSAAGEWEFPGNLKPYVFENHTFLYEASGRKEATLFIGDSNMAQYYVRVDELIQRNPNAINSAIFSTGNGCIPIPNAQAGNGYDHCLHLLDNSLQFALARKDISTVVIGGLWFKYLSGEAPRWVRSDGEQLPIKKGSVGYQRALGELSDFIAILRRNNKKVILILNQPIGAELDPKSMIHRTLRDFPDIFKIQVGGVELKALKDKYGFISNDLRRIAAANQATIIDPVEYLCVNGRCAGTDSDNIPMYKDDGHLRPWFVRRKATFIDSTVAPIQLTPR